MAIPELEKLTERQRADFLKLERILPHEMSSTQRKRYGYLFSKLDYSQYRFERKAEEARKPQHMPCEIMSRNPYVVRVRWGEFEIPDELVPAELKKRPGSGYLNNILFAVIAADLSSNKITYFQFEDYLKRATDKELKKMATFDGLAAGHWPRTEGTASPRGERY